MTAADRELLGVTETMTTDQVKARFHELALVHHPDKGGDPARFDELRQAYNRVVQEASQPKRCQECGGKGKVDKVQGFYAIKQTCRRCGGKGRVKL